MKKLKRLFWFVPALAVSTAIVPVVTSCSQQEELRYSGDIVLKDGTVLSSTLFWVSTIGFKLSGPPSTKFIPWTSVAYIILSDNRSVYL